ncbi:hypothetical protein [Alkalicoccus chagannorensis]|uniref:hypothetical protein n=1 Tax=Alkalicoccus chagannorensis TaxID=427072 RepID=UPI000478DD64|nr:hypothetical protein [Alkalicoccus chagannorensis]
MRVFLTLLSAAAMVPACTERDGSFFNEEDMEREPRLFEEEREEVDTGDWYEESTSEPDAEEDTFHGTLSQIHQNDDQVVVEAPEEDRRHVIHITEDTAVVDEAGNMLGYQDMEEGQSAAVSPAPAPDDFSIEASDLLLSAAPEQESGSLPDSVLAENEGEWVVTIAAPEASITEATLRELLDLHPDLAAAQAMHADSIAAYAASEWQIESYPFYIVADHEEAVLLTEELRDIPEAVDDARG